MREPYLPASGDVSDLPVENSVADRSLSVDTAGGDVPFNGIPDEEVLGTEVPDVPQWARHAIGYQIYPLGFCGAPRSRADEFPDGKATDAVQHRLPHLLGWLNHIVSIGANLIQLNPVFDSLTHGYDTIDHLRIDPRLGDTDDLVHLLTACHERGLKLLLDGVFNHVSREHHIVQRALAAGPASSDGQWIRWTHDGAPQCFEGHDALVELNLEHPAVADWILAIMRHWLDTGIDGWRLDAAYAAGPQAWAPILQAIRRSHPESLLVAEVIHGDYPAFIDESNAHTLTQYELWKAMWSSLTDENFFELDHALTRHQGFLRTFVPWTFIGNHDVTRIASRLNDPRQLVHATALLTLLPGMPCIYAGDEFALTGVKEDREGGDDAVRPAMPDHPDETGLCQGQLGSTLLEIHRRLCGLRRRHPWLYDANIEVTKLSNRDVHILLSSRTGSDRLTLALNLLPDDLPAPGEIIERAALGEDGRHRDMGPLPPAATPSASPNSEHDAESHRSQRPGQGRRQGQEPGRSQRQGQAPARSHGPGQGRESDQSWGVVPAMGIAVCR
ncbi:alpha-amylase family glycosyl hydrolase [Devriesea agamarum]|uniref:alpha-amylase family glycosyl hydrolase n=1 Tax=Devriesea agamarum TaxID=472569 RepID=UPI0009FE0AA6|nr:alpha-amylase family glycosyl hydrolase [Devriesea agamarum]